jgi:hypothetical protein
MEIPPALLKEIEIAFLKELARALRSGEIHTPQARDILSHFTALYPFRSIPDLSEKITRFVAVNPAYKELPIIVQRHEDFLKTQDVIMKMRKHMKAGEIDKAISVAA